MISSVVRKDQQAKKGERNEKTLIPHVSNIGSSIKRKISIYRGDIVENSIIQFTAKERGRKTRVGACN